MFTRMAEVFVPGGVPVEQSVFPNMFSGDWLRDIDGTISDVRLNGGEYEAPLNGVVASAVHNLLVNRNIRIDVLASPVSNMSAVKLCAGGSVSFACADDTSLVVCGPAMRVHSFTETLARAITVFFLANRYRYPGVVNELAPLVKAYAGGSGDRERNLCRFSDSVSYYLEGILAERDLNLNRLCTSTQLPPLADYTLLDTGFLEDSFHSPETAERFRDLELERNSTDSPAAQGYIGPL